MHQQVLFLSCVLGASGKTLDLKYLKKSEAGEKWSTLNFPNEQPPPKDFCLWEKALRQIVPAEGIMDRLGNFQHKGYKIWPWRYDSENARLLHLKSEGMGVYKKMDGAVMRSAVRWELVQEDQAYKEVGKICSMKEVEHGRRVILSTKAPPSEKEMPETILEVLEEWGCTWIWRSLRLIGDDHWLEEAIEAGTCRAVTDGSYIKEQFPNICLAAFILESKEGRG